MRSTVYAIITDSTWALRAVCNLKPFKCRWNINLLLFVDIRRSREEKLESELSVFMRMRTHVVDSDVSYTSWTIYSISCLNSSPFRIWRCFERDSINCMRKRLPDEVPTTMFLWTLVKRRFPPTKGTAPELDDNPRNKISGSMWQAPIQLMPSAFAPKGEFIG